MSKLEQMSAKQFMLAVVEIRWSLLAAAVVVVAIMMVTGCALSQLGTELDRRVRVERMMRACSNSGGIWISPEGRLYSGRCDWNRSTF